MQRLCIRVELVGAVAQQAYADRQRLVVVLHKLGELQQDVHDLVRDVVCVERRLDRVHETLLVRV